MTNRMLTRLFFTILTTCFLSTGSVIRAQSIEWVPIEGGTFLMGSTPAEQGHEADETLHTVTVGSFVMSKTEITVTQFREFVEKTGYKTDAEKDTATGSMIHTGKHLEYRASVNWRHDETGRLRKKEESDYPVIHVSWNDAAAFARWAGGRLPTEAEWEFAARKKETQRTPFPGQQKLNKAGWFKDNSRSRVHRAGEKRTNKTGLADMAGNVWEWCTDWYQPGYYTHSPAVNPAGPGSGDSKVLKGGSWLSTKERCRTAYRDARPPGCRSASVGFRIVKKTGK